MYLRIRGDYHHALMDGLGDEQAVKRVAMHQWQFPHGPEVGIFDSEVG